MEAQADCVDLMSNHTRTIIRAALADQGVPADRAVRGSPTYIPGSADDRDIISRMRARRRYAARGGRETFMESAAADVCIMESELAFQRASSNSLTSRARWRRGVARRPVFPRNKQTQHGVTTPELNRNDNYAPTWRPVWIRCSSVRKRHRSAADRFTRYYCDYLWYIS